MMRRTTEVMDKKIIRALEKGLPRKDVAQSYNVTYDRVKHAVRRLRQVAPSKRINF